MLDAFTRFRWAALIAAVLTLPVPLTLADDVAAEEEASAAGARARRGREGDESGEAKRFKDFKEVTKDMKETEGLFSLYRHDPSDKSRDPETLYAKIPAKLMNEDLLFATSVSSGGNMTGWMWTDYLFRWEIAGNHVMMVVPDTRYIAKDDQPVADAIKRTYGSGYIAALPILSMTPAGDVLVDFGKLLKSDLAGLGFVGGEGRRGGGGGPANVRAELSKWSQVKSFPDNILVAVDLAVGQGQAGRSVGIAYAFQRLPKLGGYKPRQADPRIGYFTTVRVDWAKPNSEREVAERYINRWHLEKRDPSLEMSPPKKPIVYIIEKTVPVQWRRWVRAGIEEWNQAFEKIGFVDAIIVQQQTDDNEYKDYDPEDARYNFIRWTVTGRALAVGPSRADPRTGQILDADIVVDDAWVRAYVSQFDVLGPRGAAPMKGPGFAKLLQEYPDFVPKLLRPDPDAPVDALELRQQASLGEMLQPRFHDGHACTYAEGLVDELALAQAAMVATGLGKKVPERLIGEAIKELVAHEVGHTLGLRHNFKGSSWLTLEEIKHRRNSGDAPTTASVMDYNPLLFFADDDFEKVRHFVTTRIGPYDEWAIEYGYRVLGKGDKGEPEMLKEIASRCTQPGLDYGTDEDTLGAFSPDPYTNRYDMSSNPNEWATQRLALCAQLGANVLTWAAREGEPRYYITQAFNTLLAQKGRNFQYVARLVGGQHFHRDNVGDPNARAAFVLVDPATQRAALKLLRDTVLCDSFVGVTPEILNNLAAPRWSDWAGSAPPRIDYPIHDRVLSIQLATLIDLCSPPTLQRVYDAELKCADPERMTAAELITSVRDGVWVQLGAFQAATDYTDAKPLISSISRNLQVEYLNMMLALAQMPPGSGMSADLTGMVRFALRELSDRMGVVLGTKRGSDGKTPLDFASRAHLSECKSRIDRVLDAQFQAR
jgi:hypothetical protein